MSVFAIPFFQKLVSLNDHCIQEPLESTYQDDYRNVADSVAKRNLRKMNAINEEKMKQKKCGSSQTCSKRISTYMNDYRNPHHLLSETNFLTMALKQQNTNNNDCDKNNEKHLTEPINVMKLDNLNIKKCPYPVKRIKINNIPTPEWKKIGWRDKQNCWRRPLIERKQYKLTDPNKIYDSKCCERCICR